MSKTNTGLVAYAKAQLGNPYWCGDIWADSEYGMTTKANTTMRLI